MSAKECAEIVEIIGPVGRVFIKSLVLWLLPSVCDGDSWRPAMGKTVKHTAQGPDIRSRSKVLA